MAQYGSMAMTPMKHLEEQWSESMKRKKLVEQKFRALSTKVVHDCQLFFPHVQEIMIITE